MADEQRPSLSGRTVIDERRPPQARRVVTGVDGEGRSTIVADGAATARLERPGGATVTEIWRADRLPAALGDAAPLTATGIVGPPPGGLVVRICTFPPETQLDAEAYAAYAASIAATYGPEAASAAGAPGMHQTETVDVVTVVEGELCVVLEHGETVLRAGESVVQRGTRHAWQNRTDRTTTVVAVMMGAAAGPAPEAGA